MESKKLACSRRDAVGTNAVRRLRRQGKVPAVLYGHKQEAVALAAAERDLAHLVEENAHFLELDIDGAREPAILREVQFDPFGHTILHADFIRVSLDEAVEVEVALEFVGHAKGASAGGVLERMMNEVKIRCRPDEIPSVIEVNVEGLDLGDAILARDLPLPGKAELVDDPEQIVCHVTEPRGEEEPAEGEEAEAGQAAEPEVVGGESKPDREGGEG